MTDRTGGSAWLDAILYDDAPTEVNPLLNYGITGAGTTTIAMEGTGVLGSTAPDAATID
jgi:hypothetical protein